MIPYELQVYSLSYHGWHGQVVSHSLSWLISIAGRRGDMRVVDVITGEVVHRGDAREILVCCGD